MTRFFIASKAEFLSQALSLYSRTATVEAEYGDDCVQGTVRTLAHHGSRKDNPCPCLHDNENLNLDLDAIGLSHLDLDSLGGVMALLGRKPECQYFWKLAAYVDLNGPHRIQESSFDEEETVRRLHAWWAWNDDKEHRVFPPSDGSVLDITEQVLEAMSVLTRILNGDEELLRRGDNWARAQDLLEEGSFKQAIDDVVLVRESCKFVNHLYTHKSCLVSVVYDAVVSYNPEKGTVTLSLENPANYPKVSCEEVAQKLWGAQAGGHAGIAGSPRAGGLTFNDALKAAKELYEELVK